MNSLLRSGAGLCVAPQNLVELWNVCTRPGRDNGLGKTAASADRRGRFLESFLTVLSETAGLFAAWRELVIAHQVIGKQVHDARLVAAMQIHGVPRILTFNTKDFLRYKAIEALCPQPEAF